MMATRRTSGLWRRRHQLPADDYDPRGGNSPTSPPLSAQPDSDPEPEESKEAEPEQAQPQPQQAQPEPEPEPQPEPEPEPQEPEVEPEVQPVRRPRFRFQSRKAAMVILAYCGLLYYLMDVYSLPVIAFVVFAATCGN
jgi:hypothetical protein